MEASPQLIPFTARHEGFASRAYRDPGGVITIGYGFTMLDRTFAAYWLKTRGHALAMGDTIDRAEADQLLVQILNAEYAPAVGTALPGVPQHQADAAIDATFNFGGGGLKWKWAQALAAGKVSEAAALLRNTALTAVGQTKPLPGLVRRRADEARLLESGDYGAGGVADLDAPSVSLSPDEIRTYQAQLAKLGFKVDVTGTKDTKTATAVAVFQQDHGLKVDGIVGPATRSALVRAVGAQGAAQGGTGVVVGGAATGGTADATAHGFDLNAILAGGKWAIVAAVVVVVVVFAWRQRGVILRRRTPV